jgi:hypothetical protein
VNKSAIHFYFGVKGEWARGLNIKYGGGSLYGEMVDGYGRLLGHVRALRPDSTTLRVVFPISLMKRGADRYRWSVNIQPLSKHHPECFDTTSDAVVAKCIDSAGFMFHKL